MSEIGNCFACRVMRSFGYTGAGALAAGLGAMLLGVDGGGAALWAVVGGIATLRMAMSRMRR